MTAQHRCGARRLSRSSGEQDGARPAGRREPFVTYLREEGVLPPAPPPPRPEETWPVLAGYRRWMREQRGVADSTLDCAKGSWPTRCERSATIPWPAPGPCAGRARAGKAARPRARADYRRRHAFVPSLPDRDGTVPGWTGPRRPGLRELAARDDAALPVCARPHARPRRLRRRGATTRPCGRSAPRQARTAGKRGRPPQLPADRLERGQADHQRKGASGGPSAAHAGGWRRPRRLHRTVQAAPGEHTRVPDRDRSGGPAQPRGGEVHRAPGPEPGRHR